MLTSRQTTLLITVFALTGVLILVFTGTLLQTRMDIYEVEDRIFRPFFITWKGFPVFLGGGGFASLLLVMLSISFWRKKEWRRPPLFLIHTGFMLLVVGEALRMISSAESYMILPKNQPLNYSESPYLAEIAITDHSPQESDIVTTMLLNGHKGRFSLPQGHTLHLDEKSYQIDTLGAFPLKQGVRRFDQLEVAVRAKRTYYPFSLELEHFEHTLHPGSQTPKAFLSELTIRHGEKPLRKTRIWMNHPLHYQGHTFYQASYSDGGASVLHVVRNRWKNLPYISLSMIAFGLTWHTFGLMRKRR